MRRRLIVLILLAVVSIYCSGFVEVKNINESKNIQVEVKGEVQEEKVYTLAIGSTFEDLLNLINLKEDADLSSFSSMEVLSNNQIIVIPSKNENVLQVSLNSATIEELCMLPGIGESTASKIIEYRTQNGSFNSIEEIKNVKGIGDSKFNKIKEYLIL